jgi:polar amino acid transport system permease protein
MAIGVLALSYILRQVETEFLKNFQDFAIVTFLYALAIVIAGKIGSTYQSK